MTDEVDYNQLKFVLNFFIKAKDESKDAFVLFDESAASYILDLADRFQDYVWSNDSSETKRLRVFNFALAADSALFVQMIARLHQLGESEYFQRKFRSFVADGVEHRALKAYFAPFRPDDTAMAEAVAGLRTIAQR